MPEITFPSVEALPDDLRTFARVVEGGDGQAVVVNLVPQAKLSEFRDTNTNLMKERDKLTETVKSIADIFPEFDPNKAKAELAELRTTAQRVKDGTLKESGDVEEAIKVRTQEMRSTYEEQLRNLGKNVTDAQNAAKAADNRVKSLVLSQEISKVCMDEKSGVQASAVADIMARAQRVFEVNSDDTITPKKGGETIYGSDGVTPMTANEWVASLKSSNGHLFKQSGGGGNGGGNPDGKFGGFTQEEYMKMSPDAKIALGNKINAAKRARR